MTRLSADEVSRPALWLKELIDFVNPAQRDAAALQKPYEQCRAALTYQYQQDSHQAIAFILNSFVKKNPEWTQDLLAEAIKSNNVSRVSDLLCMNGGDTTVSQVYPRELLKFIVSRNESSYHDLLGDYGEYTDAEMKAMLSAHMQLSHQEYMGLWQSFDDDTSDDSSVDEYSLDLLEQEVQRVAARRSKSFAHTLSALQLAIERDEVNPELVKKLLESGVDANARNPFGETVLFTALRLKHYDIAWLLLRYGDVDLTIENNAGQTALHVLVCLVDRVSSFDDDDDVQLIALLAAMLRLGANVNAADINGRALLYAALRSENASLIDLLLEAGADVDQSDYMGATVLQCALAALWHDENGALSRLVERSNNVDRLGQYGHSALDIAAGRTLSRPRPYALVQLLKKSKKSADEKLAYISSALTRTAEDGVCRYDDAEKTFVSDVIHGRAFKTASLDDLREEQRANGVDPVLLKISDPGCTIEKLQTWLVARGVKFGSEKDYKRDYVLRKLLEFFKNVSFLLRQIDAPEDFADACKVLTNLELSSDSQCLIGLAVDRERNWRRRCALAVVREGRRTLLLDRPESVCGRTTAARVNR